ncbi:short-chain collagen C4-like [Antedon mediterranea]|uniref:short-chain collagen C4-like n=1 Tax=Antedon mediterranea TaxID=105859 RepID=UPI003AF64DA8
MLVLTYKVIFALCILHVTQCMEEEKQFKDSEGKNIWNFFFGGGGYGDDNQNNGCPEVPVTCETRKSTVVYTRWGRQDCNPNVHIVYTGYIAGGHYTQAGGLSNALCLPHEPEYNDALVVAGGSRSNIYGAEYETSTYAPWGTIHDKDALCAVCLAEGRSTSLMIPAKRTCPEGWKKEYEGLLMGGHQAHAGAQQSLCIDGDPQSRHGSVANDNGLLLYPVVGICGSLPCPPYVNTQELACVVCTR